MLSGKTPKSFNQLPNPDSNISFTESNVNICIASVKTNTDSISIKLKYVISDIIKRDIFLAAIVSVLQNGHTN